MGSLVAVWRGTDLELKDLEAAAARNCRQNDNLACDDRCPHRLLGVQKELDILLFMRRIAHHLIAQERVEA